MHKHIIHGIVIAGMALLILVSIDCTSRKLSVSEIPEEMHGDIPVRERGQWMNDQYVVQVGAFTNINNSVAHAARFTEDDYPVYVLKGYVDGHEYNRVQIGPYDSKDDAIRVRDEILELYDEAIVVPLQYDLK